MAQYRKLLRTLQKRAQAVMNKPEVQKKRRQIEKLITQNLQTLEPKVSQAYEKVRTTAIRCGIDVAQIEKNVVSSFDATMASIAHLGVVLPFKQRVRKSKRKGRKQQSKDSSQDQH